VVLTPEAGVKFAGAILRATVSTKRGHREEREATVKHCAGMPGVSGVTVAHYAHVLAAGASAPGIPAPSDWRAEESQLQTSGRCAARMIRMSVDSYLTIDFGQ
jgi:hypothetical protein